jgi:hypothetical protein
MIMARSTVQSEVAPLMYRVDEAAAALRLSRSSVYEADSLRPAQDGQAGPTSAGSGHRSRRVCRITGRCCVNRRAKGDGGLSWDVARERCVASATIGYDGRGWRLVPVAALTEYVASLDGA